MKKLLIFLMELTVRILQLIGGMLIILAICIAGLSYLPLWLLIGFDSLTYCASLIDNTVDKFNDITDRILGKFY